MNREILRLAIPNIVSNISVPLLSAVDTALMGHLSVVHLGAIGMGTMIFNFLYWNFGFLRMGATGMTAQYHGAGDHQAVSDVFWRSLILALCISLLLLVGAPLYFESLVSLIGVAEEHYGLVVEYFELRIWAAPATLMLYALLGWFFGLQDSTAPLLITVVVNLVNVILSYYLVEVAEMGMTGVALGTVIAQYIGLLVGFFILLRRYSDRVLAFSREVIVSSAWVHFFRVNRDLFIRTLCLTLAFVIFYKVSSAQGSVVLAAHVVLLQYVHWLAYVIDGYAFAAESIVGKYIGRRDGDSVKQVVNLVLIWGFAIALAYTLFLYAAREPLLSLFTTDKAVSDYILSVYFLVLLTPLVSYSCYVWDGIYIGALETEIMRDTMLVSTLVYWFMVYYLMVKYDYGLWISFIVFLFLRGISLALFWKYKVSIALFNKKST